MTIFQEKPTFIVVVFHGDDTSPGGMSVVDDGFDIQWFDCEGVNDPDRDSLWKSNNLIQCRNTVFIHSRQDVCNHCNNWFDKSVVKQAVPCKCCSQSSMS